MNFVKTTDMPFKSIAINCGFNSLSYFYRSFKKQIRENASADQSTGLKGDQIMQKKTLLKKTAGIVLAAALTLRRAHRLRRRKKMTATRSCWIWFADADFQHHRHGGKNPEVIQASKYIMEEYEKLTGVKTEFATSYGRSISAPSSRLPSGTSTRSKREIARSSDILPSITSRTAITMSLWTSYLELPNPYVEEGQRQRALEGYVSTTMSGKTAPSAT